MANYCKTCGADLPVENKTLTWKEFVDWAKKLNKDAFITDRYVEIGNLYFYKDGIIYGEGVITRNRTLAQMKSIIENLL